MKSTIILIAQLFTTCFCYSQQLTQSDIQSLMFFFNKTTPEISTNNVDSTLTAAKYWPVSASYDGRDIETSEDMFHLSYKFVKDGRVFIGDDLTNSNKVFVGYWIYNKVNHTLTITADNDKKIDLKIIMLVQGRMLMQAPANKKYLLWGYHNYYKIPDGLALLIAREHLL